MTEEWKDVKGFEGIYQISNLGNLRSLDRYINNNGGRVLKYGMILKPFINGSGYYQCRLYLNGKRFQPYLHKLVAEAFIDNSKNLEEVNNIDHDKKNCKIDNLEWCTRKENMIKYAEFHNIRRESRKCLSCEKPIYHTSIKCVNCNNRDSTNNTHIHSRKVKDRPSKEELQSLIASKSFLEIGRMYNVSDNAIRKWCKSYGLPYRKKDLKNVI